MMAGQYDRQAQHPPEPAGADPHVLAEAAARRGDMFALFDCAGAGLAEAPDDARLRYLQTLALARLGEPAAALALYARNRVAEIGDEDAIALQGRILKDMAVRASGQERQDLFRAASAAYRAANAQSDGYFSAINAATTALLAGDDVAASALAAAISARPEIAAPSDFYTAATAAECMLLSGNVDAAAAQLVRACALPGASLGARASTMRQFSLIAERLALADDARRRLLGTIQPPPVLHYSGHMFPAGWGAEPALAAAVGRALDETGAVIAYGALACGADILVAEAVLERGGELNLVLPFDEDDFLAISVVPGGEDWVRRYEAVRAQASSLVLATRMRFVGDDNQFTYGSRLAMGLARLRAGIMHADALQIALSDGGSPQAAAGTAVDLAEWARQGGISRVIAMPPDRPRLPPVAGVNAYDGPRRAVHAILFADFSGFSKLSEFELPRFLNAVLESVAGVLAHHAGSVLVSNTWGDAVHAIIATPEAAALIALEIQALLDADHLAAVGLPEGGGMRISLHLGPIYEDFDPVRQQRTYYGTEVTLAARIEPRVPVGGIYVTQPFAAMLDERAASSLSLEYVGVISLAKNHGACVIYRLGRR